MRSFRAGCAGFGFARVEESQTLSVTPAYGLLPDNVCPEPMPAKLSVTPAYGLLPENNCDWVTYEVLSVTPAYGLLRVWQCQQN